MNQTVSVTSDSNGKGPRVLPMRLAGTVTAPVGAALAIVAGNGVRMVILTEVMGADGGIGFVLSRARTCLDIPELYACVLLSLMIVCFFEILLIRPLENALTRWRGYHDH